jgi:DNA-binding response OmpR family regulator
VERILLIYDCPESPRAAQRILEAAGYHVTASSCGHIAMNIIYTARPALVVLDVCTPGKLIQNLCRQIRDQSESVPLLVLSFISDVEEVVLLLGLGADDCLAKPFMPREFLARARAAMR